MQFKYKAIRDKALETYREHGMEFTPDLDLFNGYLIIEADDQDTADKIRQTYTDTRMWERILD